MLPTVVFQVIVIYPVTLQSRVATVSTTGFTIITFCMFHACIIMFHIILGISISYCLNHHQPISACSGHMVFLCGIN